MTSILPENFESIVPTEAEVRLAATSSESPVLRNLNSKSRLRIQVQNGAKVENIEVPQSAIPIFLRVLTEMAKGHSVTLIPTQVELTTQQAADQLNVSRPFLIKLLEQGKIPFRSVGRNRRIRLDDLLAYKSKDDESRARVLDELTKEAQELGLGY